jgi:UDP-N-acetylglucosamine--N-acetylmuramyl-(pentapeptide) pyrophosphoryl-undecaprenol N-acetylglucosamine transferase
MTVAEVAAAGVAALFIPYPHAVDDHQSANARFLSNDGAAWLQQQKDLTPEGLSQWLLARTRAELSGVAQRARHHARPQAAQRIADICEELAGVSA